MDFEEKMKRIMSLRATIKSVLARNYQYCFVCFMYYPDFYPDVFFFRVEESVEC